MASLNRLARVCITVGNSTSCGGGGGDTPSPPVEWDGNYETLPNLVAGWLPDRGLYKDAEGTEPADEGEYVLGWRDFVQNALLTHDDGPHPFIIDGVATITQYGGAAYGIYVSGDLTLAGSISEAVVGSVPREGEVVPNSTLQALDDAYDPFSAVVVSSEDEVGGVMSAIGKLGEDPEDIVIYLPESPSFPVSLRVEGTSAKLVNLGGELGEQEGNAEPVDGVAVMYVVTAIEGAANIPPTPVLLFSEPLPAEIRTQLLNKLKDDFPAWGDVYEEPEAYDPTGVLAFVVDATDVNNLRHWDGVGDEPTTDAEIEALPVPSGSNAPTHIRIVGSAVDKEWHALERSELWGEWENINTYAADWAGDLVVPVIGSSSDYNLVGVGSPYFTKEDIIAIVDTEGEQDTDTQALALLVMAGTDHVFNTIVSFGEDDPRTTIMGGPLEGRLSNVADFTLRKNLPPFSTGEFGPDLPLFSDVFVRVTFKNNGRAFAGSTQDIPDYDWEVHGPALKKWLDGE